MAMLLGQRHVSVLPDEDPEARTRMPDLFEAFEKLEAELRLPLELLRVRAIQSEVDDVFENHCP
jgi:hypothetical protein